MSKDIPDIVIHRLPLYLRALEMMDNSGRSVTSSQELGRQLGISSAQIRKDLSHFGEFGKQGTGYEVEYLREQLRSILQVDLPWKMVLVGAGALGHALVNYGGFQARNFQIEGVFDIDPAKIGQPIGNLIVEDQMRMLRWLREKKVKIGILAVPAAVAQRVADLLVEGGVRAILSYAPITISVPNNVQIEYIDPITALQSMTYYLEAEEE
jgi:redox-sensing transcriptional repressor